MKSDMLQTIKERRSVREFTAEPVSKLDVMTILEAGSWAPSVRNTQPWKFVVIHDPGIRAILSDQTIYGTMLCQCQVVVAVFLDTEKAGDDELALQSAGAVVQNMLLASDSLGLGAVWLGDLKESRDRITLELGIEEKYRLAAMLAIGYPAHRNQKSHRKHVNDFILKTIGG